MDDPASVIGDALGVRFPTSIEALREQGAAFLTTAFQATGVLATTNRVTEIIQTTEFFGGGMGRKLLLSVGYESKDLDLHTELFVKFPRDFGDPLRDLFGPLMEPECRFALLSRREGFPIAVPKCYFADYNAATTSGILITERIGYGTGVIEPHYDKCLDYTLSDPLAYYRALTLAMARLAGYHKAGRLGAETEAQFPFHPGKLDPGSRIPYTTAQLHAKLAKLQAFAAAAPHLFEAATADPDFLHRFVAEAPLVLEQEAAIRVYLDRQPDFITLCHWNMNLDNAWFWRDADGLHAGLLDWGSVGQMNLAQAFYGMICAAETDFLNSHKAELLALFVDAYHRSGGPALDLAELAVQLKLATALLGIAWMLDAPSLIEAEVPDSRGVRDRRDPRLRDNFLARAQLQLLNVFLNEWRVDDIGGAVRAFAGKHGR